MLSLPEPAARRHANAAAAELTIAQALMQDLAEWQHALTDTRKRKEPTRQIDG